MRVSRAFAFVLALVLLGCASGPTTKTPTVSDVRQFEQTATSRDEVISAINGWVAQLVPAAAGAKLKPQFANDPNVAALYKEAATSINEVINAYITEVRRGPNGNLNNIAPSAEFTDTRVRDFMQYVDTGTNQAVDWIAWAPVIGKAAKQLYEWFQERKKKEIERMQSLIDDHVKDIEQRKVETDISKL